MGTTPSSSPDSSVSMSNFTKLSAIGRGGYGRVWTVQHKPTNQTLALKEMSKARVVSRQSVFSVLNERYLLSIIKHPFVVNMQFAFQDKEFLYLVMDLAAGGDLRFHLQIRRTFTETEAKFFAACVITGLEYLHINGIVHRDIKPENLVLDLKGYLRITDFGIAKSIQQAKSAETSGTPGYMAPEVILKLSHGIAVDYFALGVIVHELMTGRRPYTGRTRKELKERMLVKQAALRRTDVPKGWSLEAADFVNKLLTRKPNDRLGFNGPSEVKHHAWLRDFPWKRLFEKALDAPFRPNPAQTYDPRVANYWFDDENSSVSQEKIQDLFVNYYFDDTKRVRNKENYDNNPF